jgi:transposase InsO family protein
MSDFALEKGIKLKYSTSYYPQGNGLAESTNKNYQENGLQKP